VLDVDLRGRVVVVQDLLKSVTLFAEAFCLIVPDLVVEERDESVIADPEISWRIEKDIPEGIRLVVIPVADQYRATDTVQDIPQHLKILAHRVDHLWVVHPVEWGVD
tara:strand:+ start:268 stop:588 length:321 start_codon:yes stop_codon:yes gene_type:complete